MATWKAEVFVNSRVGRINTEVEAATFQGAKEQIYAKHGDVQQIVNLREVRRNSGGSDSSMDIGSTGALIGLVAAVWAFATFTPWIVMGLGGALGTWIGELTTGQSVQDYADSEEDNGHKKMAITLSLALILGGVGFVQGHNLKNSFNETSVPTEVKSK